MITKGKRMLTEVYNRNMVLLDGVAIMQLSIQISLLCLRATQFEGTI